MNIIDLEGQTERQNQEINNLTNQNNKEVRERMEVERNNQQLDQMLKERTSDLNRTKLDLDHSNIKNDKLLEDNNKLFSEIERLKSHVMVITEQNQSVLFYLNIVVCSAVGECY